MLKAVQASHFSLKELTHIYNQTRTDYIVPMPMNEKRLTEYLHVYSADLTASCVIVNGNKPCGLGVLGVRPNRAWITRLGVVATNRQAGAGRLIMDYLIDAATQRKIDTIWLEVIKGNLPAYKMFKQYRFEETRELLVVRRPPNFTSDELPKIDSFIKEVELIQRDETLKLLYHRRKKPNWLNEAESMENVGRLEALMVRCSDGCGGWVSFDVGKFQLTRIVVEVTHGDPAFVTAAVLRALHRHYPTKDTMVENIATADPKWAGFQKLGYFDSFRRIEMVRRK